MATAAEFLAIQDQDENTVIVTEGTETEPSYTAGIETQHSEPPWIGMGKSRATEGLTTVELPPEDTPPSPNEGRDGVIKPQKVEKVDQPLHQVTDDKDGHQPTRTSTEHPNATGGSTASSSSQAQELLGPTVGTSTGPMKIALLEQYKAQKERCEEAGNIVRKIPPWPQWRPSCMEMSAEEWNTADAFNNDYMDRRAQYLQTRRRHRWGGIGGAPTSMLDISDSLSLKDFEEMTSEMATTARALTNAANDYLQYYGRTASARCCRCRDYISPERRDESLLQVCRICDGIMHIACHDILCAYPEDKVHEIPDITSSSMTIPPTLTSLHPPPTQVDLQNTAPEALEIGRAHV